jgi:hypothetical protein
VEIYSYNDHVRLLSPEPVGWLSHHQLYSGVGADIVMESIVVLTSPQWPLVRLHATEIVTAVKAPTPGSYAVVQIP